MVFVIFSHLPKETCTMETTTLTVSTLALEQFVNSIEGRHHGIFMRYRVLGGRWHSNFMQPKNVRHERAIPHRQNDIILTDLSDIAQVELVRRFGHFEANCHYQVSDKMFNESC
jgi:hypothetical protein